MKDTDETVQKKDFEASGKEIVLRYVSILSCIILILGIPAFLGSLFYYFIFYTVVPYIILVVGLFFLIATLVYRIIFKKWIKIVLYISLAVFFIPLLFSGGKYYYKEVYIPSITVNNDSIGMDYAPFSNSKYLAHLDEPATLKLEDDLPVLDGATALIPVYCAIAEAVYPADTLTEWNKEYEEKAIINYSTTTGAYESLINGDVDIIFVASPSAKQYEMAKEKNVELNLTPIGYEAFVFLVNKKNPVKSLTIEQVKKIFTGKITNWKEVGGRDTSIRVFQRDENSGSQTMFLSFMGKDAHIIPPETNVVMGMDGLIDRVADYQNHSNSIGFSFRFYVETLTANPGLRMLAINGIEPTEANIANHTYPMADTFFAVTRKGEESENTLKLLEWILSEQGQNLIEKTGYTKLVQ